MANKIGKITREPNAHPLAHEERTADALALAGFDVKFIKADDVTKTPDIYLNGRKWEMKSPTGRSMKSITRNLVKTVKQSGGWAIIDSQRVRGLTDHNIKSLLVKKLREENSIKDIVFVTRKREVICIKDFLTKK